MLPQRPLRRSSTPVRIRKMRRKRWRVLPRRRAKALKQESVCDGPKIAGAEWMRGEFKSMAV